MRESTAKKVEVQNRQTHRTEVKKDDAVLELVKDYAKKSSSKKKAQLTTQEYVEQMERRNFERLGDFA